MRNSGLYVHVPFCRTKCVYCDFYSIVETGLMDAWLKASNRRRPSAGSMLYPFRLALHRRRHADAPCATGSPGYSTLLRVISPFLRRGDNDGGEPRRRDASASPS